jgi:succinate-semialdehyde dehydrogenase/glutarate-semialdehyde dehydrogenase
MLRRWFDLITQNQEDLATIITAENGKPTAEAKGEVVYAADFADWFAGAAPRIEGSVCQSPTCLAR